MTVRMKKPVRKGFEIRRPEPRWVDVDEYIVERDERSDCQQSIGRVVDGSKERRGTI